MQALGKSHSIIAVGTSLHSALVVDNELIVNPNLLHAGREIVNAILRNIDETLGHGTIVVGTTQSSSIVWLTHLHLVQIGDGSIVCPLSISPVQLIHLQIIALYAAQLQASLRIIYLHGWSIVLLLHVDGSYLAHLARRQYGSNLDDGVATHLDRLCINGRSWSWKGSIQGVNHLHRTGSLEGNHCILGNHHLIAGTIWLLWQWDVIANVVLIEAHAVSIYTTAEVGEVLLLGW